MKFLMGFFLVLIAISAAVMLVRALRIYLKYRGKRIVSCPANHRAAAVEVSAAKAAAQSMVDDPYLELSKCSRWPGRVRCGQMCMEQIAEAPKSCLVSTIVNQWYTGKECVYCHKPFHEIHWHDHAPALLDEENRTIEWKDVPAENLQQTFRTHLPVCWNCHIAQTFRRLHPELVVTRPPH